MTDRSMLIPLEEAHEVLFAVGIGPESRGYQRWKRADGIALDDLEHILTESMLVLGIDWRESPEDATEIILRQLSTLGFNASSDLGEDGTQGTLTIEGAAIPVKYAPADKDDFDNVIGAINKVILPKARYRKFASCEGSDGWLYVVLPAETWQHLNSTAKLALTALFTEA